MQTLKDQLSAVPRDLREQRGVLERKIQNFLQIPRRVGTIAQLGKFEPSFT